MLFDSAIVYEYDQTLTPESFIRAMRALKHAAIIEPNGSRIWRLLARLYVNIFSLDFPGFKNPLEKAMAFAEKLPEIKPNFMSKDRGLIHRCFKFEETAAYLRV